MSTDPKREAKKRLIIFLVPLSIFVAVTLLLMLPLLQEGYDPKFLPSAMVDKPFPEFSIPSIDDPSKPLTKDIILAKEGFTLVNVWATWCPTCAAEHEVLNSLAKEGVNIVGVNYKDERADASVWLRDRGNPYSYTVYDHKGSLGIDLGVYGAPETFIVNPQGIITYRHVGAINMDVWNSVILPKMQ